MIGDLKVDVNSTVLYQDVQSTESKISKSPLYHGYELPVMNNTAV